MSLIKQLELDIGEFTSPSNKSDVEGVLTRLVGLGLYPEEALYLVKTVWECAIDDLYSPCLNEDELVKC